MKSIRDQVTHGAVGHDEQPIVAAFSLPAKSFRDLRASNGLSHRLADQVAPPDGNLGVRRELSFGQEFIQRGGRVAQFPERGTMKQVVRHHRAAAHDGHSLGQRVIREKAKRYSGVQVEKQAEQKSRRQNGAQPEDEPTPSRRESFHNRRCATNRAP